MSVSGYSDRQFTARLHQTRLYQNKTHAPHCLCRLIYEMSTRREQPREGCLLSAMSFPEKTALKNQGIFVMTSFLYHNLYLYIILILFFPSHVCSTFRYDHVSPDFSIVHVSGTGEFQAIQPGKPT